MKIIIHNIIAPYRTPLFDALSKMEEEEVLILYIKRRDSLRKWDQNSNNLKHKHKFLKTISFKNINFSIDLITTLLLKKPKEVICLDDSSNIVNFFTVWLLKFFIGYKLISWFGIFEDKNDSYIYKLLKQLRKKIYRRVDSVWSYSKGSTTYLAESLGFDIEFISEGLQGYPYQLIPSFPISDIERRFEHNKYIYIGTIDRRKNVLALVNEFIVFCSDINTKAELHIIGEGALLEEIKKISRKHPIFFHNYVDGKEKYKILDSCKFLILPSLNDPWGWVVNEASWLGVPSIVSTKCMSKEMLDKNFVFSPEEKDSILKKIILSDSLSIDEYSDLCNYAKSQANKHSLQKALDSYARL